MKKKLIAVSVVVLILGVTGVLWSSWAGDETEPAIRLSGNIELTEINVAFKTSGKIVELAADEGSTVQRGMLLARIDRSQIERQREKEQAGLSVAQSQLTELNTAIQYSHAATESDIALRQAELKQAQAHHNELLAGSRPQEIEQAQAVVAEARTQRAQAAQDWERAQRLYADDDISTAQRDQFQARYESTGAALKQAEQRLAIVKEGPRREQIDAARAQVDRAQAAVRLSEANWIDIRRKEQEVSTRRAEIDKARAQVEVVQSQIEDTLATSPIDGVVLSKSSDLGEVISAGTTVMTIGDMDRPWVRGYITEPDLGRVKLGTRVQITTDSFPGKIYGGRISFIASNAEFTPKHIQTSEERVKLVYRIKIDVDNAAHELKLNMPVDATILLNER
jgi:HlyD family secretion protein